MLSCCVFFFSSRSRHTSCSRDWSSDLCSSDLHPGEGNGNSDQQGGLPLPGIRRQPPRRHLVAVIAPQVLLGVPTNQALQRSEERRVGKEGRSRWSPYH